MSFTSVKSEKYSIQIKRSISSCHDVSKASAAGGFCSGPASWDAAVHGAVLPPLLLLPLPRATDRHAEGPDECSLLGAGAHHCGVQEPGQEETLSLCRFSVCTLIT